MSNDAQNYFLFKRCERDLKDLLVRALKLHKGQRHVMGRYFAEAGIRFSKKPKQILAEQLLTDDYEPLEETQEGEAQP